MVLTGDAMTRQEEYNILGRADRIAIPIIMILFAAFALALIRARWSWISSGVGVLVLLAAFVMADALKRVLRIADEGLSVTTLFRPRGKLLAWDSIEKVIVSRKRDGHTVKRVLVVGRNPGLPPEAVHHEYDEQRGTLFEPLGRRMIAIPGNAPDLSAVLQRLQDRVPNAFPSGA